MANNEQSRPMIAGGNHELRLISAAIDLTKGETVLPICPTTPVHPKPILLTSVGNN